MTGNDDDALVDALTSSELSNEVGQAAHIIKVLIPHIMTTPHSVIGDTT